MRLVMAGFLAGALVISVAACKSSSRTGSGAACQPSSQPASSVAAAGGSLYTVKSGGAAVLVIVIPKDALAQTADDKTVVILKLAGGNERVFYIWPVAAAKSPADAAGMVEDVIKSEFKNLKVASTRDMVIAGGPGRYLTGPGVEADDGDPGNAEVAIFSVGGRVFAACAHGESDAAARCRDFMLSVIQTATAPK